MWSGHGGFELKTVGPSRLPIRLRAQLQDLLSLVVGYGMAALLFRAFWPPSVPSSILTVPGAGLYLWLGLAMSGPIILLRQPPRRRSAPDATGTARPIARRTWAELAWILIGSYWIILGLLVIPARLHQFKLADAVLFGLVPVAVALCLRLFGPEAAKACGAETAWTHAGAVGLLATWPIAWACLILLGIALR
jgi:hypothetical protein